MGIKDRLAKTDAKINLFCSEKKLCEFCVAIKLHGNNESIH